MGDTDPTELNGKNWRDLLTKWLFSQGVSTILLFAIGVGVWYGWPAALANIQSGYERMEKSQQESFVREREHNETMIRYIIDNCCDEPRRAGAGMP
jgi:hypothetical protein